MEIVPLRCFEPGSCSAPWGDQYVSGPLDGKQTFPGVPIRVRQRSYAAMIIKARLAVYPEAMRLERLAEVYRSECDNRQRWAKPPAPAID